jgi:hypothetical protein
VQRIGEGLFILASLLLAILFFPAIALASGLSMYDTPIVRTQLLATKVSDDADKNLDQSQSNPKSNDNETKALSSDPFSSKDASQKMVTPNNSSLGLNKHRDNKDKVSTEEANLVCNENQICKADKKSSDEKGSGDLSSGINEDLNNDQPNNNIRFELPINIPFP